MQIKIKNNKFIKYILIPIMLILVWLSFTFLQILLNDESVTVIKENYSKDNLLVSHKPILKGEKRYFKFIASQNSLGIITISFNTYNRFNFDTVIFRIKDINEPNWYYEKEYDTRAFTSLNSYPFGFPIIKNSHGREYLVEIESLKGNSSSSVGINANDKILSASYQFDKNLIFNNRAYFMHFLYNKTINSFINHLLLFTSSVFFYPFIFYILWLFIEKKIKSFSIIHNPLVALIAIAVAIDILLIDKHFDLVYLIISLLWIITLLLMQRGSREGYITTVLLLIIALIFQIVNLQELVENIATWAFLSLIVSVMITIYEVAYAKFKKKKS